MRADFYGALMMERCWRELKDCQYAVAPLDEPGLRAAIVEPAMRVGVHVDGALVERLVRESDCDRSSSPLPLLQVALRRLWARLRWRYLTLADYEGIFENGQRGLAAALALHADGVLQRLAAPGDRAIAQRILLDLVHLGEGRPHTRRRRLFSDLRRSGDAVGQLERVLHQLAEGRIVTTGDDAGEPSKREHSHIEASVEWRGHHVDLAHDALIAGWPQLGGWIAERCDDLRTQRRLEARAATGVLLMRSEIPEFVRWRRWAATPDGQLLGASKTLHSLVRRSLAARRLRRGGLIAMLGALAAIPLLLGVQDLRLHEQRARTLRSFDMLVKFERALASNWEAQFNISDWQCNDLALYYDALGELTWLAGRHEDAHAWFEKVHAIRTALVKANPLDFDRHWVHELKAIDERLRELGVRVDTSEDALE